jgi:hypothetical protein
VTQGIFIEGGLTRDGAFQKPKLGMLDYIVTAKRDPAFDSPLFIIPTAINYDRVLEDRNLTEELLGRDDRSTKTEKLNTTFDFLFKNILRSAIKRFKRYGYAIVTFGKPLSVDAFIAAHPEVLAHSFDERKAALQMLAESIMSEISAAIPVTPVTLAASILDQPHTDEEIVAAIDGYREKWRDRVWLLREKTGAEIWRLAKSILELRHLVQPAERWRSDLFDGSGIPVIEEAWQWNPNETLLRNYYANSLLTFEEVKRRGWPERPKSREQIEAQAARAAAEA